MAIVGRKSKYTPEIVDQIVEAVKIHGTHNPSLLFSEIKHIKSLTLSCPKMTHTFIGNYQ